LIDYSSFLYIPHGMPETWVDFVKIFTTVFFCLF